MSAFCPRTLDNRHQNYPTDGLETPDFIGVTRQRPLPLPGNLEISLLSRFGTLAISGETFTVLRDGVGHDTRRLQPPVERDLLVHL